MRDKTDMIEQAVHKRLTDSATAAEEAKKKYGSLAGTIIPAIGLGIAVTTFNSDLAVPLGAIGLISAAALYFAPVRTEALKHDLKLFGRILGIAAGSMIACLGVLWVWPGDEKRSVVVRGPQLEAIEKAAQGGKREESSDPRKELANIGVTFDVGSMHKAYIMGDERTMELLLRAGLRPDLQSVKWLFWWDDIPDATFPLFAKYRNLMPAAVCTGDFLRDMRVDIKKRPSLYVAMCGPNSTKDL